MALEDILRRISQEARKESNKVERDAKAKARQILADAKKKATLEKKKIAEAAKVDAEREKKRVTALAKLEGRNIVLRQKQEALTQSFDAALNKLLKLPDEQYLKIIKKMLKDTVAHGDEEVIVSANDKKRIGGLLAETNKELAANGRKGNLKLSDETREELRGGFILKLGKIESTGKKS